MISLLQQSTGIWPRFFSKKRTILRYRG